jgi:hypothetical protein
MAQTRRPPLRPPGGDGLSPSGIAPGSHGSNTSAEALGRSRGGLSTKIHLVADLRCRPIACLTSPGQREDSPWFNPRLGYIRIDRRAVGRPRTRPGAVLADKAYSSKANRAHLRTRGITAVISVKDDQAAHRRKFTMTVSAEILPAGRHLGPRPAELLKPRLTADIRPSRLLGAHHNRRPSKPSWSTNACVLTGSRCSSYWLIQSAASVATRAPHGQARFSP